MVATLAGFVALMIIAAITVVLFVAPASPSDLALIWSIWVVIGVIGWALNLLWKRMTRKRRQYRNSG